MLATSIDKINPSRIDWSQAAIQPKLDGHRALYKDGVLYSRQGKVLENLDHVLLAIKESGLEDLHLDGEIYCHGYTLQELARRIKKWVPETLTLEYHIYDIVDDKPFLERIGQLAQAYSNRPWDIALQAVETILVDDMEEAMSRHELYRNKGYEGTMLRHGDEHYRDGKRSLALLKIKEFHDAEFTVIDVEEGKPYIKPDATYQVPVWVCAIPNSDKTFTVTAEGTMQEKHDQWLKRESYINKPLTVKYHYLSKDGIPQLPVALRWREDL